MRKQVFTITLPDIIIRENHHMVAALLYQTETDSNKYFNLLLNIKSSANKKPEGKVFNFSVKLDYGNDKN